MTETEHPVIGPTRRAVNATVAGAGACVQVCVAAARLCGAGAAGPGDGDRWWFTAQLLLSLLLAVAVAARQPGMGAAGDQWVAAAGRVAAAAAADSRRTGPPDRKVLDALCNPALLLAAAATVGWVWDIELQRPPPVAWRGVWRPLLGTPLVAAAGSVLLGVVVPRWLTGPPAGFTALSVTLVLTLAVRTWQWLTPPEPIPAGARALAGAGLVTVWVPGLLLGVAPWPVPGQPQLADALFTNAILLITIAGGVLAGRRDARRARAIPCPGAGVPDGPGQ